MEIFSNSFKEDSWIHRWKEEDTDRINTMKIILVFSSNFKNLSGSVQADCHHRRNSWGWVWSWWISRFIIDERPKKLEWFFKSHKYVRDSLLQRKQNDYWFCVWIRFYGPFLFQLKNGQLLWHILHQVPFWSSLN